MKIAYCQLNLPIEVDIRNASKASAEITTAILKYILSRGHEVTIYSSVSEPDIPLLNGGSDTWLGKIKYEPKGFPIDEEALICINGATNLMWQDRYWKISYMHRCFQIIDKFKGVAVYFQSDGKLPMPFNGVAEADKWTYDKGTPDTMFKDKHWIVAPQVQDIGILKSKHTAKRYRYDMIGEKWDVEFFRMDSFYPFDSYSYGPKLKDFEEDLVYIGTDRYGSRRKILGNFFPTDKFSFITYGMWSKKYRTFFEEEGIRYGGVIDTHEHLMDKYNNVMAGLVIGEESYCEMGFETCRPLEITCAKTLPIGDIRYRKYLRHVILPELMFLHKKDLEEKVAWLKTLTKDQRLELMVKQIDMVKDRTPENKLKPLIDKIEKKV